MEKSGIWYKFKAWSWGRRLAAILALWLAGYTLLYVVWPRLTLIGRSTEHKVHVAFGFHANLYHSFRIDTNDEAGFGKDIRVIRHTIKVFDRLNKAGIPAKAVWDIENLFSLEETLPKHAPDIIRDIKRRIDANGDEVILMSYNNGLVSAMTEREFNDSIKRAISNSRGSGVQDVFGRWTPVVRPQEMMTTPGNFKLYKDLGIQAISLYNSAITFDTFRVFVPELTREQAHNPLRLQVKSTGQDMIVIPTYNIGDLVENVSLGRWVKELHREQLRGNINRDVLVFINFDADDQYWVGLDLPKHLKFLPNTGGIEKLIQEVAGLDYVQFTNLDEYLKHNKPAGDFYFGQDTADGSFNGYNSWSEKSYVHEYWTDLMNDRRADRLVRAVYSYLGRTVPAAVQSDLDTAYERRLRLLSTTNFGMATPYLARARERVVEQLIQVMNS
ncbi:MAG: hypothetical protein KDK39_18475, partial [Leptospiraceae bacterium]|nr:hypothetical protein [Leptospiraceae bacterium]